MGSNIHLEQLDPSEPVPVMALISHGIVAMWIVSCLALVADGLNLDRYILRNCYGVVFITVVEKVKENIIIAFTLNFNSL